MLFVDTPVLCGHRGSGRGVVGGHRENTLDSYRAAVDAGLPWVEVDARFNADDMLVARHDPVVDDGRFISEMTTAETDAEGVMRVEDLLGDLPPHVGVDVDVKSSLEDAQRPRDRTTGALVAGLVERAGAGRPLLVSSFDPAALLIVRERIPEQPLGLITWTRFPLRKAIPAAVHLGVEVVAPHFGSFPLGDGDGPALERDAAHSVRVAHEAGLQVVTWCPKPAQADALMAAGVDCLIVDDAPAAAERLRTATLARRGL
ncbi:MAG: glycerophosphoryl diester phosphodiesterase [Thermoleophilaceae bacterium]|nr:glycerophosphoryl diester phosphodiesterase [Thermoleophilaceae bacterium]